MYAFSGQLKFFRLDIAIVYVRRDIQCCGTIMCMYIGKLLWHWWSEVNIKSHWEAWPVMNHVFKSFEWIIELNIVN